MKVPLIDSVPPSEFGEVQIDPAFADANGASLDHTYVPGFSDMRRKRDIAIAAFRRGEIASKDVPTLPVNLRWTRAQRVSGEPDNTKLWTAAQRGYTPVKAEQIGTVDWLAALPLGAVKDAQGMIRNGDTVLTVATAQRAGQNMAEKAKRTRERMTSAQENFTAELSKQRANTKGADPYVESTVAKKKGA